QAEAKGIVFIGPIQTNYWIPVKWLDKETERGDDLHPIRTINPDLRPLQSPLAGPAAFGLAAKKLGPMPEKAEFNFAWLSSPGTAVFASGIISILLLRM